jgi:hypothetical protein
MDNNISIEPVKQRRGRKKKTEEPVTSEALTPEQNISIVVADASSPVSEPSENAPKKRGRKPKGGKLVVKDTEPAPPLSQINNIILHLKCSLSDLNMQNESRKNLLSNPLEYNPAVPPSIVTFNDKDTIDKYASYNMTNNTETTACNNASDKTAYDVPPLVQLTNTHICSKCSENSPDFFDIKSDKSNDVNMKDITSKLKNLKIKLYKSSNQDKKAACFWCTYEYDNPACYIPKFELNDEMCGYGSFCRPECAVAYLMKENIDDTTKFERYHLINQIYGKASGYNKNIKPAPDPYYLLDKFYGNLTIQEYRKLLKTDHMLLVVEKPMTRILPELHDDVEDLGANIYGGKPVQYNSNTTGVYKVKRQSEKQKGPSKTDIMKENFGF